MENNIQVDNPQWKMAKYNTETGEMVSFLTDYKTFKEQYADKIEKASNKLIKLNTEKGLIEFKDSFDGRYVATYIDVSRRNPLGNNIVYRGYVDLLRERLCKFTNAIVHDKEYPTQAPRPMSYNDLMELTGLKRTRFKDFIETIKQLGIICEVTYDTGGMERKAFLFNPAYSHQSVHLSWETIYAFSNNEAFLSVITPKIQEQYLRANKEIKYLK